MTQYFQVVDIKGMYAVEWFDTLSNCTRRGYNRFVNASAAVEDIHSLQQSSIRPIHWPVVNAENYGQCPDFVPVVSQKNL